MMNWEERLMEKVSVEVVFEELKKELSNKTFASGEKLQDYFTKLSNGKCNFKKSKKTENMFTGLIHLLGCSLWIKAYDNGKLALLDLDLKQYCYVPEIEDFEILNISDEDYAKICDSKEGRFIAVKNYIVQKKNISDNNVRKIVFATRPKSKGGCEYECYEYKNEVENNYIYSMTTDKVIVTRKKLQNAELFSIINKCCIYY